jgi:hypothetical protein
MLSHNSNEVSIVNARSESTSSHVERVPLHFRCLGIGCEEIEYATETVKIWLYGFLMRSKRELTKGTMLYLRLRVPIEISGSPFREMRSIGRVVSEHELEDGTVGYSVEIERAPSSAWTLNQAL